MTSLNSTPNMPALPDWMTGEITSGEYIVKAVDEYERAFREQKRPAYSTIRPVLKRIRDDLGCLRIDQLKPMHVASWVRRLKAERTPDGRPRFAPPSVRKYSAVLSGVFQCAVERGWAQHNPVRGLPKGIVPLKSDDPQRDADQILTSLTDLSRLASSTLIPPMRRAQWCFGGLTGCRHGELLGARWGDIDRDAPRLWRFLIQRQWALHEREYRKTKTKRMKRVPVHPALRAALEDHERYWRWTFGRAPTRDDLLFPAIPRGKKQGMRPKVEEQKANTVLRHWRKDLAALAIPSRTLHTLRHSFLTNLSTHGVHDVISFAMTHGEVGPAIHGVYRYWRWDPLCDAILSLPIEYHRPMEQTSLLSSD